MKYAILLITFLGVLAGCEDTSSISNAVASANSKMEAQGSPFRYAAQDSEHMVLTLMPLPTGPTRAVPPLAKKTLEAITTAENRKGRSVANLQEVRYLQDGREVWVLQSLSSGIAYVVAFANPSQADSSIRVTGPTVYAK